MPDYLEDPSYGVPSGEAIFATYLGGVVLITFVIWFVLAFVLRQKFKMRAAVSILIPAISLFIMMKYEPLDMLLCAVLAVLTLGISSTSVVLLECFGSSRAP